MSLPAESTNGTHPLRGYTVVDGGDIVGIMQRGGGILRLPAWTVIGDHLILGAHPADTMPPDVDAIANVDSFRFYDVPEDVLYLHFSFRDGTVIPDPTTLHAAATFLNDLRAAGRTVFIHCRLGLNRSALLAGLVLMGEGWRADDAIATMRTLRSPYVLDNSTFERYLRFEDSPRLVSGTNGLR